MAKLNSSSSEKDIIIVTNHREISSPSKASSSPSFDSAFFNEAQLNVSKSKHSTTSNDSSTADEFNVIDMSKIKRKLLPPLPSSAEVFTEAKSQNDTSIAMEQQQQVTTQQPPPHDHIHQQVRQRKTSSVASEHGASPMIEHDITFVKRGGDEQKHNTKSTPAVVVAPFNNPAKKIYFNKTFIEALGLSYATVQRQQIQQQKREDEEKHSDLRNMSINSASDYEKFFDGGYASSHSMEEEDESETDSAEISDDFQTTIKSTSWSEYIAHHKNAFSLVRVIASQWSWGEMTLGLEYYTRFQSQTVRDFTDYINESLTYHDQISDDELRIWKRFARLNFLLFREPVVHLAKKSNIALENIICFDKTQQTMRPAYFLFLDRITEAIVLIFRGTKSFSDLITDLHCSSIRYRHGYCHKGILCAAQWFRNNSMLKKIIKRSLEKHPGYKLILSGHSLGGGTAAILTDLWKEENEFPGVNMHCYAFACPPVLSQVLAVESASYITTIVNGDDFVTRLSMTAIEELRKDVSAYPWKEEMMRDIQNSAIVKFAAGVKNVASGIFSKGVGLFYKKTTTQNASSAHSTEELESYSTIYPKEMSDEQIMDYISKVEKLSREENAKKMEFPPLPPLPVVTSETQVEKVVEEVVQKEDASSQTATSVQIIEAQSVKESSHNSSNGEPEATVETNTIVAVQVTNTEHPTEEGINGESKTATTPSKQESVQSAKVQSTSQSTQITKKKTKSKKQKKMDDSPFIINDYENLVVSLYPAGKIYQMRNINSKVYIKESSQEEFSKLILSETWKDDHKMVHYVRNIEYFTEYMRGKKDIRSRSPSSVSSSLSTSPEDSRSPTPPPKMAPRKHPTQHELPPIPTHLIEQKINLKDELHHPEPQNHSSNGTLKDEISDETNVSEEQHT